MSDFITSEASAGADLSATDELSYDYEPLDE